ncbi:MAG TPA: CDGSH iron-sulfur domain-containing protein [Acidimicrobiales bacterium]|nr:CDGSH iron-sulfur domain-containing protein [Acidimicrobiales bacterium]
MAGPDAFVTTVEPRRDGPLVVTGRVALAGPDGAPSEVVERLFLCRCGASGDKPRCDGTHKRIGFTAPGVAPPRSPAP